MNLWQAIRGQRSITTIDDYISAVSQFIYQGNTYPIGQGGIQQTLTGQQAERVPNSLEGYAQGAYASNGVVFACMTVRALVFSAIRFQYQRFRAGRPSDLFGGPELGLVEEPWTGGTTQDLLLRMIQDADLAGNAYWTVRDGELVRLRPDWVEIVLQPRRVQGSILGYERIGYIYTEQGPQSGNDPIALLADEVAHFAPIPDPLATYRGMSWLTPVIRQVQNDGLMERHKRKFFENGATPNVIVSYPPEMTIEKFLKYKERLDQEHKGVDDAYKTLHLGGGADATVVGADFKQMDFKSVQGAGETRVAAAAGVHPVIVGLSEGLQGSALNAGNYAQARRRFADGTMHPLWQNAAGSLQRILPPPDSGSRLWYDARDVPFLREDEKDAAQITFVQAQTMRQWIDAGYTADSVKAVMLADDIGLLEHSGMFSVQLQPPGMTAPDLTRAITIRDVASLARLLADGWRVVPSTYPLPDPTPPALEG